MERSNYRIFLDIRDSHGACVLDMKQADTHRRLRITLTEGGKPYPVADSCYAVFTAKKPDGTVIYNLCTTEKGDVIYDITPQTTAAPGLLACEIRLLDGETPLTADPQGILPETDAQILTSAAFGIRVHPTVYDENSTLASATEVSALSGAVLEAKRVARSLEEARDSGAFNGVSASHSWSGTVLTLTSGSGTSSADLRGPKGDKGDPGQFDPDDSSVGNKPWSSRNILDRLCPGFTMTGMLLQCYPAEGYPLRAHTTAEYSCQLVACGKNIYDSATYPLVVGYMIRHSTGTFYPSDAFSATEAYIPISNFRVQTLYVRNCPNDTNTGTNAGIVFYDDSKQYISGTNRASATVPENAAYLRFSVNSDYAAQAQLEVGSSSPDYEPYRGVTYTQSPGETITLPALSGKNILYAYYRAAEETAFPLSVTGRLDPVHITETLLQTVRQLGGNI